MEKKITETTADKQQTSGVIRTIAILETLSRHQSINLEQLSKQAQLPKATLLRFLSTLVSLGYVYRD
ncbi:MAG: MarR family transcriptional regulator, partial [Spirochaetia bacterium]|nr:MarR family transcriptional regulator [Spirochaetia bacterium]